MGVVLPECSAGMKFKTTNILSFEGLGGDSANFVPVKISRCMV